MDISVADQLEFDALPERLKAVALEEAAEIFCQDMRRELDDVETELLHARRLSGKANEIIGLIEAGDIYRDWEDDTKWRYKADFGSVTVLSAKAYDTVHAAFDAIIAERKQRAS